jgi:hypothetical protein
MEKVTTLPPLTLPHIFAEILAAQIMPEGIKPGLGIFTGECQICQKQKVTDER